MRLIDADVYAAEMRKRQDNCRAWKDGLDEGTELYARAEQSFVTFVEAALTLKSQPTIEAIPVVRCKKCVHWLRDTLRQNSNDVAWWNEAVCDRHSYDGLEIIKKWTSADFYCADGERRDEDAAD